MIARTLGEVAALLGGSLQDADPAAAVTGAVTDSRRAGPGLLFVALPGEHADGHDHAADATRRGSPAALVARPVGGPALRVPDPLDALQQLGARTFAQDQPVTVGVTGSSGKTSTKDLLGQVLGDYDDTLFPEGSFNNEIGLPLTLLRRTAQTRFAVLEYSARGRGHIAALCRLARPDVATVLNVGSAHVGEFGGVAAIEAAKGELVEAARHAVVLNADDAAVLRMARRTDRPVTTFGTGKADVTAEQVDLDDDGKAHFVLRTPHGDAAVRLGLVGEHHVLNALAAAAATQAALACPGSGRAGALADVERLADLLGRARPLSRWRMEVTERPDGVTVVNDAYNANPESMRAALRSLAVLSRGKTRRTVAVLGPMAELGDEAQAAHLDLGRFVVRLDVSQLVVVGEDAGGIHAGAVLEGSWGSESVHVPDVDAAVALLRAELAPGDVVLVKASRSAGLERVAAALLEDV